MATKSNILIRVGGSLTLQLFLLLMLPRLKAYNNGQEEVKSCLIEAMFSVLALWLVVPLLCDFVSAKRLAILIMMVFPVLMLFSALRVLLFYLS